MNEDAATRKQGRPSERPSGIHANQYMGSVLFFAVEK